MGHLKEPGAAQLWLQRYRTWASKTARIGQPARKWLAAAALMVLAYRLLVVPSLLRQRGAAPGRPAGGAWPGRGPGRRGGSLAAVGAADAGAAWLPPHWVGTPPPVDPLACTPQLLIAGAMKGGTTALFHYLNGSQPAIHYANGSKSHVDYNPRLHPGIIGAHVTKEMHFFDKPLSHVKNRAHQAAYFGSFPGVDMARDDPLAGVCSWPAERGLTVTSRPGLVRMEATAMYLAHPHAAGNIKALLPQMRLVMLLREPVGRALSSANMLFQRSKEYAHLTEGTPEYNAAWQAYVISELRRQLQVLRDCFSHEGVSEPTYSQIDHCVFDPTGRLSGVLHIHVGLYAVHLERWFVHFSPQQLLLWSSHAFEEKPREHMEQLIDWLGLNPTLTREDRDFVKLHERTYPRGHLPAELFEELAAFYEPQNQRLFKLLERHGYGGLVHQLQAAWALERQQAVHQLAGQ